MRYVYVAGEHAMVGVRTIHNGIVFVGNLFPTIGRFLLNVVVATQQDDVRD